MIFALCYRICLFISVFTSCTIKSASSIFTQFLFNPLSFDPLYSTIHLLEFKHGQTFLIEINNVVRLNILAIYWSVFYISQLWNSKSWKPQLFKLHWSSFLLDSWTVKVGSNVFSTHDSFTKRVAEWFVAQMQTINIRFRLYKYTNGHSDPASLH